jgi:hypothetical protein
MSDSTVIQLQNVGVSNPGSAPFSPALSADSYVEIVNAGHDWLYVALADDVNPVTNGLPVFPQTTSAKIYIIGTDNGGTGQIYLSTAGASVPSILLVTTS